MKGISKLLGVDFTKFGWDTIPTLIVNVIRLGMELAGMLAVLFIIIGGYRYITAFGNEANMKKGKDTIQWAVIGLAACILSYVIVGEVWKFFTDQPLPGIFKY